jgi:hypothetical protein
LAQSGSPPLYPLPLLAGFPGKLILGVVFVQSSGGGGGLSL